MSGKGDRYRPMNRKKWDEGWDRAFGRGHLVVSLDQDRSAVCSCGWVSKHTLVDPAALRNELMDHMKGNT